MKKFKKNSFLQYFPWGAAALVMVLVALISGYSAASSSKVSGSYQPWLATDLTLLLQADGVHDLDSEVPYAVLKPNSRSVVIRPQNETEVATYLPHAKNVFMDVFSDYSEPKDVITSTTSWIFANPLTLGINVSPDSYVRVVYVPEQKRVEFHAGTSEMFIDGTKNQLSGAVIYAIDDVVSDYMLGIGKKTISLKNYNNDSTISVAELENSTISLFKEKNPNILEGNNVSFENEGWLDRAADCSAHLSGPSEVYSKIVSDASLQERALLLGSSNHFACMYENFPVSLKVNMLYSLSVDYRNVTGDIVQMYYVAKNKDEKVQDEFIRIQAQDKKWNTLQRVIFPQSDSNNIELFLYAPAENGNHVVNLYDNVRIAAYEKVKEISVPENLTGNYQLLENIEANVPRTIESRQSDINLIAEQNSSFEEGLWQQQVMDCSNYLKGDPQISMQTKPEGTHGNNSLELSSDNHFACSLKTFSAPMKADTMYVLSFDYKNIAGGVVQYYFAVKGEKGTEDHFERFETTTNEWQTKKTVIRLRNGDSRELDLYFYAPSDGSGKIVNAFDNVRLSELSSSQVSNYYLQSENENADLAGDAAVEYKHINRWQTKVVVHNVDKPFTLVMPKFYSKALALFLLQPETERNMQSEFDTEVALADGNRDETAIAELISSGKISAIGEKNIVETLDNVFENENLKSVSLGNWASKNKLSGQVVANNRYNAWVVDARKVCGQSSYCRINEDGTYDVVLLIQHSGVIALYTVIITTLILALIFSILAFVTRKRKPNIL